MDNFLSTFLGAFLGGLITIITAYYTNKWAREKDRELWDRQRDAEREKLFYEDRKTKAENLNNAYLKVLEHIRLSNSEEKIYSGVLDDTLLSDEDKKLRILEYEEREVQRRNEWREAVKWLWVLVNNLNNDDSKELSELKNYLIDYLTGNSKAELSPENIITKLSTTKLALEFKPMEISDNAVVKQ